MTLTNVLHKLPPILKSNFTHWAWKLIFSSSCQEIFAEVVNGNQMLSKIVFIMQWSQTNGTLTTTQELVNFVLRVLPSPVKEFSRPSFAFLERLTLRALALLALLKPYFLYPILYWVWNIHLGWRVWRARSLVSIFITQNSASVWWSSMTPKV